MLNTIAQIGLGICYGIYLAFLAPTSQRQKAHELLKQRAVVPARQKQPMLSLTFVLVAEPTTQSALEPDSVENPWLAEPTPITTEIQESPAAIAIVPKTPQLLLLPSAQLNLKQTSNASSRRKTKATQGQQFVAQAQAKKAVPAGIRKMTVEQLRSLCNDRNIKWQNAHGSKHLTKTEMLERLTA